MSNKIQRHFYIKILVSRYAIFLSNSMCNFAHTSAYIKFISFEKYIMQFKCISVPLSIFSYIVWKAIYFAVFVCLTLSINYVRTSHCKIKVQFGKINTYYTIENSVLVISTAFCYLTKYFCDSVKLSLSLFIPFFIKKGLLCI